MIYEMKHMLEDDTYGALPPRKREKNDCFAVSGNGEILCGSPALCLEIEKFQGLQWEMLISTGFYFDERPQEQLKAWIYIY